MTVWRGRRGPRGMRNDTFVPISMHSPNPNRHLVSQREIHLVGFSLDARPGIDYLNHGSFGACPSAVLEFQAEYEAQLEREPFRFLARELEPLLAARARSSAASSAPRRTTSRSSRTRPPASTRSCGRSARAGRRAAHDRPRLQRLPQRARRSSRRARGRASSRPPSRSRSPARTSSSPPCSRRVTLRGRGWRSSITSPAPPRWSSRSGGWCGSCATGGSRRSWTARTRPGWSRSTSTGSARPTTRANAHKWLCAPKGAAFLHVRRDLQEGLHPLAISHGHDAARPGRSRFRAGVRLDGDARPDGHGSRFPRHPLPGRAAPGGWPLMARNHALCLAARAIAARRSAWRRPAPTR